MDVVDLNEILILNSMWPKNFLSHGGAALVWKLGENQNKKKIKMKKKTEIIEYDGS